MGIDGQEKKSCQFRIGRQFLNSFPRQLKLTADDEIDPPVASSCSVAAFSP